MQLRSEFYRPGRRVEVRISLVEAPVQLLKRIVMLRRELTNIHRCEVEPECGERPHHACDQARRDQAPLVGLERFVDERQFVEDLLDRPVARGLARYRPCGQAPRCVDEALVDVRKLEPVWLLRIEFTETFMDARQLCTIEFEAGP